MERLNEIKNGLHSKNQDEWCTWDDIEWLIEQVEKLQTENERYKEINQGLIEVQFSLRDKEKENKQWFEAASKNVMSMEKEIHHLQSQILELKGDITVLNSIRKEGN